MSKSNRRKNRRRKKVWVDPTQDTLFENANTKVGLAVLEPAKQQNEFSRVSKVSIEDWAWRDPTTGEWTAW